MAELKAVGLAGSPRAGANSETLLAAALDGAASAGAKTELIRVNDLDYKGCQVCEACKKAGRCVVDADMQQVYGPLEAARVWIIASPIYFDALSGQMKSCFDRLWCWTHNKLPGARSGGVIVTYEDKERQDYLDVAKRPANYFNWMGQFDPVEVLHFAQLGAGRDDAKGREDLLDTARAMGRRLALGLALPQEPL